MAPTYRASAGASNNGVSVTVVMPGSAVVGDVAIASIAVVPTSVVTPPVFGSWVPLLNVLSDGGAVRLYVYYQPVLTGMPGANQVFASSVTGMIAAAISVYANVGGLSVAPLAWVSTTTEVLNSRVPRFPSVVAGPDDRILAITGAYGSTNLSANGSTVTSAPTGFTIRQNVSNNPVLQLSRGSAIMDAPSHALAAETLAFQHANHSICAIMVLAPQDPRWADSEHVPSTLAGKPGYVYGSSSSAFVQHPSVNFGYNTRTPWGNRAIAALGSNADSNNMSTPGARAADVCCFMYGTRSWPTRAVSGDALAVAQVGTWSGISNKDALILTDAIGNDIINHNATLIAAGKATQANRGAAVAADAIFRLLRSSAVYHWNLGNITATGTWSTVSSDGLIGGSARLTTVPGAKYDIAVSGITALDIVLIGGDNTAGGNTGSTYAIKVDGVTVATGTTHNQMLSTGFGQNYGFCQMVVPVTGMTTGAHTITIEHTGSSGHLLMFNGALLPNPTPPWVVTNCLAEMPAATYTALSFTKVTQDAYREILRTVTQQFADGRVVLYDPSVSGLWNYSAYFSPDGVHQNELGHAHYTHEILRMLSERVA